LAEDRIGKPDQSPGSPALREKISCEREERDSDEDGGGGHPVHFDDHGGGIDLTGEKEIKGNGGDDDKEGCSE
jgi:hypothetical protein